MSTSENKKEFFMRNLFSCNHTSFMKIVGYSNLYNHTTLLTSFGSEINGRARA